ncbi:hypothetical protein NT6N_35510 [Oceaniferula spumae]|uniref:Uncharacterized protein n=1 Tax=Oceaniferula spumae TaxID=2979115 RepID=A0AAT9FR87_9BACT
MKNTCILALITCLFIPHASAEEADKPTPKKRPSHADLVKKKAELDKEAPKLTPVEEKAALKVKKRSLIGNSTLLANNGQWTLVPKGAVLYVPKQLQDKVVQAPSGYLVDWKTFLRKNHGWLHLYSVNMTQAQGKDKVSPEAIKAYTSIGKVVVATCSGGPISVAPDALKPEEEEK